MPIYRDKDGNIVEEKTRPVGGASNGDDAITDLKGTGQGASSDYDSPTQPVGSSGQRGGNTANSGGAYDAQTIKAGAGSQQPANKPVTANTDSSSTQVYRPGKKQGGSGSAATAIQAGANAMDDPPVGWLVIVAGPGQGNVLQIGIGTNTIGRDHSERIVIDFGDEHISRTGHTIVTYDPKSRKFFIQHGGGKNLTYMNEAPVLAPTELPASASIQVGETTLRFSPFCGDDFDWQDVD
jgi:hypothetical protein